MHVDLSRHQEHAGEMGVNESFTFQLILEAFNNNCQQSLITFHSLRVFCSLEIALQSMLMEGEKKKNQYLTVVCSKRIPSRRSVAVMLRAVLNRVP